MGLPAASWTVKGLALGLVAGVMSGLFGIGGGAVLVPLLVAVVGLAQHRAHATSLAAIILTAVSGALAFADEGAVLVVPGALIALGAVVGAVVGAAAMHRLSAARLRLAFALLLVAVAVQMLVGFAPSGGDEAVAVTAATVAGLVALGLVAGALSALMGVGGGVIMVPAMVVLFGISQHAAEGTSLLIIIPTALVGAARHARHGYTDWRLGLVVGVGGIVGARLGATVALALDAAVLQRLFGAFLLVTAVRMLVRLRSHATTPAPAQRTPAAKP